MRRNTIAPVSTGYHRTRKGSMYQKGPKFYADWRDASGKRLRKSFTSKRAALHFEAEQKELAHPKQTAKGRRRPYPSRGGPGRGTNCKPPASRSQFIAQLAPPADSSAPRTSPKSTTTTYAPVEARPKPTSPPFIRPPAPLAVGEPRRAQARRPCAPLPSPPPAQHHGQR